MSIDLEIPTSQKLIATFFRHNLWANLLLCDGCLALTEEQLDYSDLGAYGSIRMTLDHIARAEERYLYHLIRWEPAGPGNHPVPPTVSDLKARLQTTGPLLLQTALTTPGDEIAKIESQDEIKLIPANIILLQAIHHGQEHRTQIASMMGQLRIEPPSGSGWDYYYEALLPNL